jgi:alpha-beta hydrolase superfamily lysophospholipase
MNQANAPSIAVPVLLLYGTADPAYQQPQAGQDQRNLFSGSKDVTLRFLAGQAHALTLERAAPDVQSTAADWLARRGF